MLCGTLVHKYEPLNGSGELYSSPRAQMNTYFSHVAIGCVKGNAILILSLP